MRVFSIRMLRFCCSTGAVSASATISLLWFCFHLNSDFGGMGPSRLNQQRLLSMSRHHQLTPVSLPGESWQMIEAGAAVVDSRIMAAAIRFIGRF
jgi:hypothetical protein